MAQKMNYTFPVTFDLTNKIHVQAKEKLEQLSQETGLNKKQVLLLTLSMLNVESVVGCFTQTTAGSFVEKTESIHRVQEKVKQGVVEQEIQSTELPFYPEEEWKDKREPEPVVAIHAPEEEAKSEEAKSEEEELTEDMKNTIFSMFS